MATCITIFSTQSAYNTYINGNNVLLPNVSICEDNDETYYKPYEPKYDYSQDYLTFIAKENTTFTLSRNAVSYSLDDGETWTSLAKNTASPTVTTGNKIMWKGTITPASSYGIGTFSSTGNFDVRGNIMSLLYEDNFKNQADLTGKNNAFCKLFQNTKVINIENLSLPATTLVSSCYEGMFNGCTSLKTAPKLLATTLKSNCYRYMFSDCTSLTTAPELPAITLAGQCYYQMFGGCTSLITAPELPATSLASYCYSYMFSCCTSLATPPELHSTTLKDACYFSMFEDCTSLTAAPELPATTLAPNCYNNMFSGCTNLTEASIVPNSVKPVSSDYCEAMYRGSNVPMSSDYSEAAWEPSSAGR